MNLLMLDREGAVAWRSYALPGTVVHLGLLAVAAGACTVAAGLWSSPNGKSWLLVMNGFAFSALGCIFALWKGPLAFRTIALLIAVMALSLGLFVPPSANSMARSWYSRLAGAVSIGFALAFCVLASGWIRMDRISAFVTFVWMAAYFGFSAVCKFGLALQINRGRLPD